MHRSFSLIYRIVVLLATLSLSPCLAAKTVIISFDGFRWDYLEKHPTPNMDRVIASGFRVRQVRPTFPSLTFPNHVSLVTGQTPAEHGIAANQMYDRRTKRDFDVSPPQGIDDPNWYQSTMLWEFARKEKRKTAAYFWVGSEVQGRHPDRYFNFTYKVSIEARLNRLQRWLDNETHPNPELMLLYFHESDSAGHKHGPHSKEVADVIARLDLAVGRILTMLDQHKEPVYLFIVSDHGMADCLGKGINIKEIEQSVDPAHKEKIIHNWTQTNIFLKKKDPALVKRIMAGLPQRPFITWYTRETFPHPLHPTRTGDIIGIFAKGYQILEDGGNRVYGAHGYPIDEPDMQTICFGRGPGIKPGVTIAKTDITDFFPLVAHLMKLEHGPVAGKLEVWQDILIDPLPKSGTPQPTVPKETQAHE